MSAADSSFVTTSHKLQETKVIKCFVCSFRHLVTFQISLGFKFQIRLIRPAKLHQYNTSTFMSSTLIFSWTPQKMTSLFSVHPIYTFVLHAAIMCTDEWIPIRHGHMTKETSERSIPLEMKLLWQCCAVIGLPIGSSVPLSHDALNSTLLSFTPWQSFCRGLIDFLCL